MNPGTVHVSRDNGHPVPFNDSGWTRAGSGATIVDTDRPWTSGPIGLQHPTAAQWGADVLLAVVLVRAAQKGRPR